MLCHAEAEHTAGRTIILDEAHRVQIESVRHCQQQATAQGSQTHGHSQAY